MEASSQSQTAMGAGMLLVQRINGGQFQDCGFTFHTAKSHSWGAVKAVERLPANNPTQLDSRWDNSSYCNGEGGGMTPPGWGGDMCLPLAVTSAQVFQHRPAPRTAQAP